MTAIPKYDCDNHLNEKDAVLLKDLYDMINDDVQNLFAYKLPQQIMDEYRNFMKDGGVSFKEAHDFAHKVVHLFYEHGNNTAKSILKDAYEKGVQECLITE